MSHFLRSSPWAFLFAIAIAGHTGDLPAQTQVIPAAYAAAEAASSTSNPWRNLVTSTRVQYCYDASLFAPTGPGPIVITGIRWRANAATNSLTWTGGTFGHVVVDVSTCATDYLTVSGTFDANHGADRTNVRTGAVVVQPGFGNGTGVPGPWFVDLTFDTPFLYDPAAGDFLIDIGTDITTWSGGTSALADNESLASSTLGSRVLDTTAFDAATGTVALDQAPVIELSYSAATGLVPSFTATPVRGTSPLLVQFQDRSFSSAPGGITSWFWDFDNDGITDSTQQNPSFTFACGTYSVHLTVLDSTATPTSLLRTNLVITDTVTPSFTYLPLPGGVQFTDTTTPTPTSWAWDLDGDQVVDSTQQNPVWPYLRTAPFTNVTLTVGRLCGPSRSVTKPISIFRELLFPADASTFLSSPSQPAGGGLYFDVAVGPAREISLEGFEVACQAAATTPVNVEVYVTNDSRVGIETTATAWRLAGTGSFVHSGSALQRVLLQSPVLLSRGNYGVMVNLAGAWPRFASSTVPPFGNSDLTVTPGAVRVGAVPFVGTMAQNRAMGGRIFYSDYALDGLAGVGLVGLGCPGTLLTPMLTATNPPHLGQTYSLGIDNMPVNAGLMLFGFSSTTSAFGPLPLDLTGVGMAGCVARVSPDARFLVIGAANAATWNLPIPNLPQLSGALFFNQMMVIDPGINGLGVVMSDAASALVGN